MLDLLSSLVVVRNSTCSCHREEEARQRKEADRLAREQEEEEERQRDRAQREAAERERRRQEEMQKIMEEKRRRALEEEAARKGIIIAVCLYQLSKGKGTHNQYTTHWNVN